MRLMAVHAHPDDESSKGSATIARLLDEGHEVLVVSCTGGERGDILNDELDPAVLPMAERDMPGLRRLEMAAAQRAVGFEHRWLGYSDSGMPSEDGSVPAASFADIPVATATRPLTALVRAFRPHVMTTYDERGGYPHPDHIRCHEVSVAAFEAAEDGDRWPEAGEPWCVSKLYYDVTFHGVKLAALNDELTRRRPDSPLLTRFAEMRERFGDAPDPTTTRVAVGPYLGARERALRAHASQVPLGEDSFFAADDLLADVWPYDDYVLARSRVDTDETAERVGDDLFAGVSPDRA